jgi:4-amino-4-deoxy-L-arabinose transferase-like glycosyltransferase
MSFIIAGEQRIYKEYAILSKNKYFITWCISIIVFITFVELAHDEAYYWVFSKNLSFGYFDHPPLIAWLIRLGSILSGEWGVRFVPALALTISISLLSLNIDKNKRDIFWGLLLCSPLIFGSNFLAIPDTALLTSICLFLIVADRFEKDQNYLNSFLLGLIISLMMYAKYHSILLIVIWILTNLNYIKKKYFWIVCLVSLILFLPHLWWQWENNFLTLKYHFLERPKATGSLKALLSFMALQLFGVGVVTGPIIWKQLIKYYKNKKSSLNQTLYFSIIFIPAFFLLSSFSKKVEANWTIMVPLLMAFWFLKNDLEINRKALNFSILVLVIIKLILIFKINQPEQFKNRFGEFTGWKNFSKELAKENCQLAANTYQLASKLSFYLPDQPLVWAFNIHSRKNQFTIWEHPYSLTDKFCFLSDKKLWPGQEVLSPEGKMLTLVKDLSLHDILKKKEN